MKTTRHDFLITTGMGVAAIANSPPLVAPGRFSGLYTDDVRSTLATVWVTDDDRKLVPASPVQWSHPRLAAAKNVITINGDRKFQNILGFGGTITDGSCYLVDQLAPAVRERLFHHLFHPSEMGLNVCRTCIGSSDRSVSLYSFDDGLIPN
jgi:glucosylceramidase